MKRIYYLYLIRNLKNNKCYIGQTVSPKQRWYEHKRVSKTYPVQIISKSIAKHGFDNFVFEIIACCSNQNDANLSEEYLIRQYQSHISENGYNVSYGGMSSPKSEEWKSKMSIIMTGKIVTQETRIKISKKLMGRKLSKETKEKLSVSKKGKLAHNKGKKKSTNCNQTWKLIDGKRVYFKKEDK